MERVITISAIFLFLMTGCGGKQSTEDLIIVDVTKKYPKKELILQDFMDVEYIVLETNDEFLTQGLVRAIGKEIILVRNRVSDGDIFIYDRSGRGLRKINRQGQGGEEYLYVGGILLDEDNNEMYINDGSRILVYDLFGKFKRGFRHKEGSSFGSLRNFDKESLICQDDSFDKDVEATDVPPFAIISKQDGSIIKDISISCQQKRPPTQRINHSGVNVTVYNSNFPLTSSVIPYHDSWILTVYSTDTIFSYLPDHSMIPFMARTPSIQSMNPEVFLFPEILTDRYYFLRTEKKEPEVRGTTPYDTRVSLPNTYLAYDRQEKTIFEYTVFNDDYSKKMPVEMSQRPLNNEIAFCQKLEADDLFDAYKEGQLKGKLKEIAAGLKEEDNPVLMLVKHKR